jgi:ABC-type spermidine/putrescine transport system permease subunit I
MPWNWRGRPPIPALSDVTALSAAPRAIDWRRVEPVLLVAPLILFMAVCYALPVTAMLMRSVDDPTWSLVNYQALAQDAVFAHVLLSTVQTALLVTVGTLLLGYPVALAMTRVKRRLGAIILTLVLLPFWVSVLVRSYAWMVLLGRHGVINEALTALGLIDAPLRLLNTSFAVDVAMIHILLPYMVLPIANALRQIDASLPRAALGLGASRLGVLWQVMLPLSLPGVMAGVVLVFVLGLGFYITPALVGGPRDVMLSQLIVQQIDLLNWPYAACLSLVLLAVTLLVLASTRLMPGVRNSLKLGAS